MAADGKGGPSFTDLGGPDAAEGAQSRKAAKKQRPGYHATEQSAEEPRPPQPGQPLSPSRAAPASPQAQFPRRSITDRTALRQSRCTDGFGTTASDLTHLDQLMEIFGDGEGYFPWEMLREVASHLGLAFSQEQADEVQEQLGDGGSRCDFATFCSAVQLCMELSWGAEKRAAEEAEAAAARAARAKHKLLAKAAASKAVSPESALRWAVDLAVTVIAGYHATVVPMRDAGSEWGPQYAAAEWVLSALLLAEVCFNFRLGYVSQGMLVDDPRAIAWRYARGWFLWDLLSAVPIDLIAYAAGSRTAALALSHLRLLRLARLPGLFVLRAVHHVNDTQVWLSVRLIPMLRICYWTFLVFHWLTLLWIVTFDGTSDISASQYLAGLYFVSETLTTVGYGDVEIDGDEKRLLATFLFLLGSVANGLLISHITLVFMQADLSEDRSIVLQRTLMILQEHSIPSDMRREVLSFQCHQLNSNTAGSYQYVFESLPRAMQQDLGMLVRISVVQRVPIFQATAPECQVALANALHEIVVPPDEPVCIVDEPGEEMFFIVHGCAQVLSREDRLLTVLRKGTFFGEIALIQQDVTRTATIRTVTYCDMLRLDRADFVTICQRFPTFSREMEAEARKRQAEMAKGPVLLSETASAPDASDRESLQAEEPDHADHPTVNTPKQQGDASVLPAKQRKRSLKIIAMAVHRATAMAPRAKPDPESPRVVMAVRQRTSLMPGVEQVQSEFASEQFSFGTLDGGGRGANGRVLTAAVNVLCEEVLRLSGELQHVRNTVNGVVAKVSAPAPASGAEGGTEGDDGSGSPSSRSTGATSSATAATAPAAESGAPPDASELRDAAQTEPPQSAASYALSAPSAAGDEADPHGHRSTAREGFQQVVGQIKAASRAANVCARQAGLEELAASLGAAARKPQQRAQTRHMHAARTPRGGGPASAGALRSPQGDDDWEEGRKMSRFEAPNFMPGARSVFGAH